MRSLRLTHAATDTKRRAISCHASQVGSLGDSQIDRVVLSRRFLEHFEQGREYFIVSSPSRAVTASESYFDGLYAKNGDPWRLSTRWYEARKRAITAASLTRARYEFALEIGSSVGELTALIAERADSLLSIDISRAAVDAATARTAGLANVRIEHRDATRDFPDERFDLIVLSEIGYYWELATLRSMVQQLLDHLADDGVVLACHWRHPVAEYPLTGDEVHEVLRAAPGLHRLAVHEEEDFLLEIYATVAASVATREGLVS